MSEFLFELFIAILLSAIAFSFSFSLVGFIFVVLAYEIFKLIYVRLKGVRENDFKKELLHSTLNNVKIFLLVAIVFVFQNAVMS